MSVDSLKAINSIRDQLEKKYKDSAELFPDFTSVKDIEVIKSGATVVDAITGIGGIPRGRVTEISGPYSSGKTTLATQLIATCQAAGGTALFIDFEHALDVAYAHSLGMSLDPSKFIFCQPEYFEQGAQIADAYISNDLVDIVVIDSAAAMTPRAELEGEMDEEGGTQKGLQAALMSKFLSILTKKIPRGRRPALVMLNQTRAYINIGGRPQKNAPKEIPAGGMAIKFYTSLRLGLEIVLQEGDENRGTKGTDQIYTQNRVRVTCTKNKLAPPFMRGTIVIEYGRGIDNTASIADLAEAKLGIMSGAGFFKVNGPTPETSVSCRGRDQFLDMVKNSPGLRSYLEEQVLTAIKQEHAKALGIGSIKISGKAKSVEGESRTMVLNSNPRNVDQDSDFVDPDERPTGSLNGTGLPAEDIT